MVEKNKPAFLILILLMLNACVFDEVDSRRIIINNNSSNKIYACFSNTDTLNVTEFNDTNRYALEVLENSNGEIEPPRTWKGYFKRSADEKIRIIFVKKDSVEKYGWKKVSNENLIDTIIKVGLIDLDRCNWEIKYDRK